MLGLAENQWVATYFLQEVARRDKRKSGERKRGGRSRDVTEGDREGMITAGSRLASSQGGFEDGRETGLFGEEVYSQEASAGIFSGVTNSRQESQHRSRIVPTTTRSR